MPLNIPKAIRVTAAPSAVASDEDTSEFLDTEEIYQSASKSLPVSEEIIQARRLEAEAKLELQRQAKKKLDKEKKLTLDDIEEFNRVVSRRRISGESSRSASTVSEHEKTEDKESGKRIKRVSIIQDALENADQDVQEVSSEEETDSESDVDEDEEPEPKRGDEPILKEHGMMFEYLTEYILKQHIYN